METLGMLVDKLTTVDLKMFYAQDEFYKIRHMTFEEFKEEYFNEDGMKLLWERFQKGIDLNLQRNTIIDEIDALIVQLGTDIKENKPLDKYLQRKHKTYG